ncbi:MAG: InlB B-repeat-containing protein [Erysipelotrichaceae bacterium]|nr:InlB B-repeat-containing protein [Erysipelotrichaceae bacterium]
MKDFTKKLVILLSSLAMIVSLVSFTGRTVHAEDEGGEGDDGKITVEYYYNYKSGDDDLYKTQVFEGTTEYNVIEDMPSREGTIFDYVFCGWSTDKNATYSSPGILRPKQSFEPTDGMKLYAVWGENKWGETLTAAGDGTTYVYDGNQHMIKGVVEKPDKDRKNVNGDGYDEGFFYQDLWYSLNVWRYTDIRYIYAIGTDVGSYSTPTKGQIYCEIWVPWPWDNEWVLVEDTFTQIKPATMTITEAPLTVTVKDQREKYTGSDITPEGTIDGLVTPTNGEQETATVTPESFKEVGAHPVTTYTINWGTAKEKNYEVTEENLGTLTIYYVLDFDANGGLDAPESMEVETDTVTLPTTQPRKPNATFLGWAKTANSKSPQYQPGQTITLTDNTTLYAVYQDDIYPPIPKTGIEGPQSSTLRNISLLGAVVLGKKK